MSPSSSVCALLFLSAVGGCASPTRGGGAPGVEPALPDAGADTKRPGEDGSAPPPPAAWTAHPVITKEGPCGNRGFSPKVLGSRGATVWLSCTLPTGQALVRFDGAAFTIDGPGGWSSMIDTGAALYVGGIGGDSLRFDGTTWTRPALSQQLPGTLFFSAPYAWGLTYRGLSALNVEGGTTSLAVEDATLADHWHGLTFVGGRLYTVEISATGAFQIESAPFASIVRPTPLSWGGFKAAVTIEQPLTAGYEIIDTRLKKDVVALKVAGVEDAPSVGDLVIGSAGSWRAVHDTLPTTGRTTVASARSGEDIYATIDSSSVRASRTTHHFDGKTWSVVPGLPPGDGPYLGDVGHAWILDGSDTNEAVLWVGSL